MTICASALDHSPTKSAALCSSRYRGKSVPDLSGRQLQAQSHKKLCTADTYTFKTPHSEPSAVEKFLHGTAISEIPSPVLIWSEYLAQPQCWGAVFNASCKSTALRGSCAKRLQRSPFLTLTAHRAVTLWSLSLTHKHKIKYHFTDIQSRYWLRCWRTAVTLLSTACLQNQELLCHPSSVSPWRGATRMWPSLIVTSLLQKCCAGQSSPFF